MKSRARDGSQDRGTIHIFEPGGRSGVYQHAVAVAQVLRDGGSRVVVHTATDHELDDVDIEFCTCFDWLRNERRLRSVLVASHFVTGVVPHLVRQRGSAVWIQGGFKLPLTLLLIVCLRLSRKRTIFSPHNLFVRQGGGANQAILNVCLRLASEVVVYNHRDHRTLKNRSIRSHRTQLILYAPTVPDAVMDRWRAVIESAHVSVCSIGQLRPDKNLDMLVDACHRAGLGLLIAGPDVGAADIIRARIATLRNAFVHLHVEYLELEDLAAILSLTGVVALPYSVASQSAVAELAKAYGSAVVAYDVGGLSEQAQYLLPDLDPDSWAAMLLHVVASTRPSRSSTPISDNTATLAELLAIVGESTQ